MQLQRVMMISDHASPATRPGAVDCGGQNVYIENLSRELADSGYAVDILTRREDSDSPEIVEWAPGVRIINIAAGPPRHVRKEDTFGYMDEFLMRAESYMRRERYHIIHANFWMSGWVAARLRRKFKVPFVVTFHALGKVRRMHQGKDDEFPDQRFAVEEQVMRGAARILAECPQDQRDMQSLYSARASKIEVIPCGVDPEQFARIPQSIARRRLGLPADEWTVLQLGRMVPRKGIDDVIRAIGILKRDFRQSARLLIVGGSFDDPRSADDPEFNRLCEVAESAGIRNQVTFTGRKARAELRYFYSAADVFVTTPWYEPFGITPLEAMACQVPVIGSRVGGISYTVADGETGLLVQPHAPREIAERLCLLKQNPHRARRLGRAGLRRVLHHFTWQQVAARVSSIYRRVSALEAQQPSPSRLGLGSTHLENPEFIPLGRVSGACIR